LHVIGIEPNADMRCRAEAESWPGPGQGPQYCAGRAEATGLPEACAAAVLAAQAFHWFDAEPALREFQRILQKDGWTVLMWNQRDEADPCTAAFGAVVGGTPSARACEERRQQAGLVLLTSPRFEDARRVDFPLQQSLDEESFVGRALSASYAPREPTALVDKFVADLRDVFARFQHAGQVVLHYKTDVYSARRC